MSKTLAGIALTVAASLANHYSVHLPSWVTSQTGVVSLNSLQYVVGPALALYGRWTATQPLSTSAITTFRKAP